MMRGRGNRLCASLGPDKVNMDLPPHSVAYMECLVGKRMNSCVHWVQRYASLQEDIPDTGFQIVLKCGFVPMAKWYGFRSASIIVKDSGPIKGRGLMKTEH